MIGLYNVLVPPARVAVRALAPLRPKLRDGLRGRRGWRERYAALGARHRDRIVWLHSTSVGEYEQARPVAALLRTRHPDLVVFHSFFSPSGFEYARRLGEAEHFDYLPEDTPQDVRFALDTVRPRALVFLKFDLWPNLVVEAHARGIPLLLLDATLQPHSWRSKWPARRLYSDLYACFDAISAVSEADAGRFRALVPDHPAIHVDGDTRFDQVLRRRREASRVPLAPALVREPRPFTLVAGSTWPADEAVLLPAWKASEPGPTDRLLLVPHEPTSAHLEALGATLRRHGLAYRLYSELERAGKSGRGAEPGRGGQLERGGELERREDRDPAEELVEPVVVVDRVGILAELYALGDAAFIGGAFSTGVHNLLEPAILGLPVLFGPRHHNAPEADLLLDAGGASVVPSPTTLARRLAELRLDPGRRRSMGGRARASVEANLGAAERCLARLEAHLGALPTSARESGR